jgi:hypothetical protein
VREDARRKGLRYLTEARLTVTTIDRRSEIVRATCRGGGHQYDLGFEAGSWYCSCLARGTCSHLVALESVVVVRPSGRSTDARVE